MSRMLVMSGGGSFGAYQAGALERLVIRGARDYTHFYGVSVGAINAAYLCQYEQGKLASGVADLKTYWRNLKRTDVYKKCALGMATGLYRNHIFNSMPIVKWLTKDLDPDRIAGSGRKLRVGAVCWNTGEYHTFDETDSRIAWWVAASSSYPNFFMPIMIDGEAWTDGGLRNVTPIRDAVKEAVKEGVEDIDVIVCENPSKMDVWDHKGKAILPGFLFRTLAIIMKELALGDLQVVGWRNEICELRDEYKSVRLHVVHPARPLTGESLDFIHANMMLNMRRGYEDAGAILG